MEDRGDDDDEGEERTCDRVEEPKKELLLIMSKPKVKGKRKRGGKKVRMR